MEELFKQNERENAKESESGNPTRKVVYDKNSKTFSPKQQKDLELGLNFAITSKKSLLECIAATENFCQSLEVYVVAMNQKRKLK